MKKILLIALVAIFQFSEGQIKVPDFSARQNITETVGVTKIAIDYSRPYKRGRVIFGELVPYNQRWRTGANMNTTIEIQNDVVINNQNVKAGKYGVFTKPGKDQWEIYFYSETENWGSNVVWDEKKIAYTFKESPQKLEREVEYFTISFENTNIKETTIALTWDNIYVPLKIIVPTDKIVDKNIDEVLSNKPKAEDLKDATFYYLISGRKGEDLAKAQKWLDKAIELKPESYRYYNMKGNIYLQQKNKTKGLKVAKKSLKMAEKAKNKIYIRENTKLIENLNKL